MGTATQLLRRFHSDEAGGPELSTVLILALVSIPLIIALMLFGQTVFDWFDEWIRKMEEAR
jgi:Flp pilus assembly pilin Flp